MSGNKSTRVVPYSKYANLQKEFKALKAKFDIADNFIRDFYNGCFFHEEINAHDPHIEVDSSDLFDKMYDRLLAAFPKPMLGDTAEPEYILPKTKEKR